MPVPRPLIVALIVCASVVLLAGCNKADTRAKDYADTDHGNRHDDAQGQTERVAMEDIDPTAPVVTVGGEILNRGEMERRKRMVAMRQGIPPQAIEQALEMMGPQLERQVIEQFIDVTLLLNEATKRGLTITSEQIDEILATLLADLPPEMNFDDLLAQQGITREEIRADIEKSERIKALVDSETADLAAATDDQVQAFYDAHPEHFTTQEEVTASHILIGVDENASEEDKAAAREKLEGLRNQIIAGELEFAAAATDHSTCPSGEGGGSLGTFGRGQMVGPFEEAAFAQPIDEVGPIVETRFGYHIIKVTGRTDSDVTALDEVRDDIAEYLDGDQKGDKIQALLKVLREQAEIKHH